MSFCCQPCFLSLGEGQLALSSAPPRDLSSVSWLSGTLMSASFLAGQHNALKECLCWDRTHTGLLCDVSHSGSKALLTVFDLLTRRAWVVPPCQCSVPSTQPQRNLPETPVGPSYAVLPADSISLTQQMEWKGRLTCLILTPSTTSWLRLGASAMVEGLLVALSPASRLLPLCICQLPSAWDAPQSCPVSVGEGGGGLVSSLPRGFLCI